MPNPSCLLKKTEDPAYKVEVATSKQLIYVFKIIPLNVLSIFLVLASKDEPIDNSFSSFVSCISLIPLSFVANTVSEVSMYVSTLADRSMLTYFLKCQ